MKRSSLNARVRFAVASNRKDFEGLRIDRGAPNRMNPDQEVSVRVLG